MGNHGVKGYTQSMVTADMYVCNQEQVGIDDMGVNGRKHGKLT